MKPRCQNYLDVKRDTRVDLSEPLILPLAAADCRDASGLMSVGYQKWVSILTRFIEKITTAFLAREISSNIGCDFAFDYSLEILSFLSITRRFTQSVNSDKPGEMPQQAEKRIS
jgi:hypothetical protein